MKTKCLLITIFLLLQLNSVAQELPIFSQKLNNGYLYNPSLAGVESSSVDFSYQRQWTGLDRTVSNLYAGAQSHFAKGRIGLAGHIFRENFNLLATNFVSGSASYHLPFGNNSGLSFGISAEIANIDLDLNEVKITQENDPFLLDFQSRRNIDFGFGFSFIYQKFQIGASTVRFNNFLDPEGSNNKEYFPAMITSFAAYKFYLPTETSWLESRVNYRYVQDQLHLLDVGMYFTYNNLITVGPSFRSVIGSFQRTSNLAFSAAAHLQNFTIAYSRLSLANELSNNIGGTNEITLRFTFNENLNFFGALSGNGNLGGLSARKYNNSKNKLMNRNTQRPKANLSNKKERQNIRNYKGKYKKLLKKSRKN